MNEGNGIVRLVKGTDGKYHEERWNKEDLIRLFEIYDAIKALPQNAIVRIHKCEDGRLKMSQPRFKGDMK